MYRLFFFFVLAAFALMTTRTAVAQQMEPANEVHCEPGKQGQTHPDELEPWCLAQIGNLASRVDKVLQLTLENGDTKSFFDEAEACEQGNAEKCLKFSLAAYYPTQKLFVIEVSAYESYSVIVVSRRDGAITRLDDYPHLSPDGTRLVAVAFSEAWDTENDIAIYSIQRGSLTHDWSYKPSDYEMWEFVTWDGNDHINLDVTMWQVDLTGKRELVKQSAELRRTKSGWQLNKSKSTGAADRR
jgi:hypothetical protein